MSTTIAPDLAALAVDIDSVRPYRTNPRKGNVGTIVESLRTNGQYRPIVVNRRTGEVLAGNHTLLAARELGWQQIAATFVDVDDTAAARIVLVDNRANDLAGYDDELLAGLLETLPDLTGTGYDDAALAAVLESLGRGDVPSFGEEPEQPSLDSTTPKLCPSCGFSWRVDGGGNVVPA